MKADEEYNSCFDSPDAEPSTSSETALKMAHEWYQSCHAAHPSCSRLASFFPKTLPTRLIDIGKDDDTHWTLRVSKEDDVALSSSYMTLSYRWGSNPRLLLLSSNITQLRQGSPVEDLPQTFRDAISVARCLGVQYIWIDALCIIQDSVKDWETEAPTMRYVYANSACNIAASASSDPEDEMFRLRDPETIRPRVIISSLFAEKPSPHYVFEKGYWDKQISDGPLHNRGWVFQERFLAPRVLYFGQRQILWECFSDHKCEGFPRGIPAHWSDKSVEPLVMTLSEQTLDMRGGTSLLVFNLWNDLIKQYSQCELTKSSDKLFAMAGIAKLFQDITGDKYVAGWWKSCLLESLDWRVFEPRPRHGLGYRAPSWSSASANSPIGTSGSSPSMEILIKLVDVQVSVRGAGDIGDILEATLTLKGAAFEAECHYLGNGSRVLQTQRGNLATWLYPDSLNTEFPEGKKLYCIIYKMSHLYDVNKKPYPQIVCFMAEEVSVREDQVLYRRLGHLILGEGEIEKFGYGWEHGLIVLV